MSMAVDGLVSGLNTTQLISQLMQAEAVPQTLLKNKVADSTTYITAMQTLNSKIAALATSAAALAKPTGTDLHTASTSSTSVTATAGTGAVDGTIDFTVDRLAQSQVIVTGPLSQWPDNPPTLTFVGSDGTTTQVTAASNSLADVASAINKAGVGVSATQVAAGTDPATGQPLYRLQLSSAKTGAAAAFTVYRGTPAAVTAGTATNLLSDPGAAQVRQAQDAQVTLWAGSAAAQAVTSSSNTFTTVLPGVSLTVSAASTTPVTLTVARDDTSISNAANALVTSLNDAFSFIAQKQAVSTGTDTAGGTTVTAGPFTGDSTVRDANQKLMDAVIAPINGISPSTYGISITSDGQVTFDKTAFTTALANNPDGVKSALATIAQRVSDAATVASDKYTGTITTKIQGEQATVKSLNTQIADWDTRLADRKATLQKTYANLEVQLQQLQSQSSWLSGQLASLSASSSSSSSGH
ncbi:flagellar filament capping protein FliD [Leifsonia shinshuensis]|uniref:Flagellar hook-associated protein 2 n=1 Tax=Leifsonia shinshuensis TaxID=150026 RepID=A0A853CSB0_9MICO|nr:flagellar filament capping protein FliD [Leifsonia shinshuensis]NYJ22104.1 flagellar hook-associated protein 2 [Leifsonia shinshuensis]